MTNPSPKGPLERLAKIDVTRLNRVAADVWPYSSYDDTGFPGDDLLILLTAISEAEKALGVFLGEDDHFQVAVGGNPNAVEAMIASARTTLSKLRGEK